MVAAIHLNFPLAKAGFNKLAASFCPAVPPAPINVWASSINKITGTSEFCTSSIICFSLFSNSPFILAPACKSPISRLLNTVPFKQSGTSPFASLHAKPSTAAVLPTPASPVIIGLFWRLRISISISFLISLSLPTISSILPVRACSTISIVYNCRASPLPVPAFVISWPL